MATISQILCELLKTSKSSEVICATLGDGSTVTAIAFLNNADPAGETPVVIGPNGTDISADVTAWTAGPCAIPATNLDYELICNPETDVYDLHVFSSVDGVPNTTPISVTPTTVPCDADRPDVELVRECRNDTIHIVTYVFVGDEDPEELSAVDTGESCKDCLPTETVCRRVDFVWVDNQVSPDRPHEGALYPQDSWEIEWTLTDGTTGTIDHPATGGGTWGPNNIQLGTLLATATGVPYVGANYGFGDDDDMTTPFFGSVGAEICPGDRYIVKAVATTVGGPRDGRVIELAVGVRPGDIETFYRCGCCGEAPTWYNGAGESVAAPDGCLSLSCQFPPIEARPESDCVGSTAGPFCHIDPADPDNPVAGDIVANGVFMELDCSGSVLSFFTVPGDDPEPYEFTSGYVGDCDSLEPAEPIEPKCVPTEVSEVPVCLFNGTGAVRVTTVCENGAVEVTFVDPDGDDVTALAEAEGWEPGPCATDSPTCVESQEWTYGIDNTGTNYRWPAATYSITLSDGSTLTWQQTTASNPSWTTQLTEWAANIQAAADAAGLNWFVEPRFIDNSNPTNIDGTINGPGGNPSGLPGAPSEVVAQALFDDGMAWRYVNIQICPGQPVPTGAVLVSVEDNGGFSVPAELPRDLATAGAVLGPIQKFWMCLNCGDEPVWYLEDGATPAEAGQVPNCWEPCGTLSLLPAPPERECQFEWQLGCDDNGQSDPLNFTPQVSRRAKVCSGEQVALDYFVADPDDASALIDYALVGTFVDCDTGSPVPEPEPCLEVSCPIECCAQTGEVVEDVILVPTEIINGPIQLGSDDCPFEASLVVAPSGGSVANPFSSGFQSINPAGDHIEYTYRFDKPVDADVYFGSLFAGGTPPVLVPVEYAELLTPWDSIAFSSSGFLANGNQLANANEAPPAGEVVSYRGVTEIRFRAWNFFEPSLAQNHLVTVTRRPVCEPIVAAPVTDTCNTNDRMEALLGQIAENTTPEPDVEEVSIDYVQACDFVDGTSVQDILIEYVFIDGQLAATNIYELTPDGDGNLVTYELQGEARDCSGDELEPPAEDCTDINQAVTCDPLPCVDGGMTGGQDCRCEVTTANFDPDQGVQWDAISVSGSTMTVTAGPNGTGSWAEQMAGSNPQCSGDVWIARMGAYDGPPGGGANLLAEGYVIGSALNVSGSDYTLGAPVLPGLCSPSEFQNNLVSAGFTAAEAASLMANGHAGVDVFGTAGATHINGVFDGGAPTPFGLCVTFDDTNCEATEPETPDPYVRTFDQCAHDKLCQIADALAKLDPSGVCACYGQADEGDSSAFIYQNADNATDVSASQNTTTIKWQIELGQQQEADDSGPFIADCINSGGEATITWTDQDGTTVQFVADSIVADGSATGGWAFGGTAPASWSGKVNRAEISCSTSSTDIGSGTGCLWTGCDADGAPVQEWRDQVTGEVLTAEQVDSLGPCSPEGCTEVCPDCPNGSVQATVCAVGDGDGYSDGDRLLLVGTTDCDGVLQSSTAYNLDNGNTELDPLPDTTACDPEPEVEEIRECITDAAGQQWTQLVVINPDGSQSDPIFINAETLMLGTPEGEPKEWTSCATVDDVEVKEACFYDALGTRYVGCEIIKFNNGQYVESTYLVNEEEYLVLPDGLRGPFPCDRCLDIAGCFDPRFARFNSITFADGNVIDLDAIYGVDSATSNDVLAEVAGYAGGTGSIPTEYSNPPSITCTGTNLHEFQFSGLSIGVTQITSNNVGDLASSQFGECAGAPTVTTTEDRELVCLDDGGGKFPAWEVTVSTVVDGVITNEDVSYVDFTTGNPVTGTIVDCAPEFVVIQTEVCDPDLGSLTALTLDGTTTYYDPTDGSEVTPADVGALEPGSCPIDTEQCQVQITPSEIADGASASLPAGSRYTIFVTSDGFLLDGIPIPCGTVLNLPDCCGCVAVEPIPITNNTGGPITIIREGSKTVEIKKAVKAVKKG